jgi:hypothetical protein
VPEDTPLFAAKDLRRDETLILAYRTARAILREREPPVPGAYYLVPEAAGSTPRWGGDTMVARSTRERGVNVALMRAPG